MRTEPAQRLFTVDEYDAMGEAGIFHPEDRVELIEGVIVEMSPVGQLHIATVNRLNRLLIRSLGDRGLVSIQNPVRLPPLSEPQPDVAVFRPREDDYARAKAESGDTLLCIEVSDTTLRYDRQKTDVYARNGLTEVWIVNIPAEQIEVYRDNTGESYATVSRFGRGETVTPLAFPDLSLAIDDILPSA